MTPIATKLDWEDQSIFNDELFSEKEYNIIVAVDNLEARKLCDYLSHRYKLTLFEGGTKGLGGSTHM